MGQSERLPDRLDPALEAKLPNLRKSGYVVTSDRSPRYNCVAYAAGDLTQKWDCTMLPLPGYYWPPDATRGQGIDALVSVFATLGYEICSGAALEAGYEKVALYVSQFGSWEHVAKQEEDGWWSSKLGIREDIRHPTPHAVSSPDYGQVMYYMRRRKRGHDESTE